MPTRPPIVMTELSGPIDDEHDDEHDDELGDGARPARPSPSPAAPRRRRPWALAVLAVAAVSGLIGVTVWSLLPHRRPDDRVLVRDEDGGVSLLDPATGATVFSLDDAVPTPDRSTLLTTLRGTERTILQSRDAQTGEVTGSTTLPGDVGVRTVSPRGGAVALMPGRQSLHLYEPPPRSSTELTVAFMDDRPPLDFVLDGNLEPEMFSLDETTLFVLDFVPPEDPTSYFVRKLDLASGEVTDTDSIQVELSSKMYGSARAQVLHPDGTFLYTLYTLPAGSPVHDGDVGEANERWAFVHVISLEEKWSFCIFLPVPFGTRNPELVGLAISPDGDTLMVGDPTIGEIATIDTGSMTVTGSHEVEPLKDRSDRLAMAVADDGTLYAAAGGAVIEIEAATFEARYAWGAQGLVSGLAVAGAELHVAAAGEVTILDRATRAETRVITASEHGRVDLLGPPKGSVTEFPLECAC